MGVTGHVLSGTAASVIAYGLTGSISFALGVAVGSLLLDADHIFDYWLIDGQRSLNPRQLVLYYARCFPLRRVLLLHSYELLFILSGLALLVKSKALGGFVAGAFVHLAADFLPQSDLSLRSRIRLYSILYRWHNGFNSRRLYRLD